MRKITMIQAAVFSIIFFIIIALGTSTTGLLLGRLPLGDFRGVALVATAITLIYLYAFFVYRIFLILMPLETGELEPGSRAEFVAQVNFLFYLMIFNSLIRTHFLPIPLLRFVYLALGARLGRDTYSAGAILDPPLTVIGDCCIIGHDAVLFAHAIEGSHFALHRIQIGNNVTIGGMATIMPDVVIDDGAIVSAGAVVIKGTRIGTGEIWGGVPARRLKPH
ncbi:MAG: acyltransferase [Candidatus Contendobacter sp.]|nr:acyltransferase [Candidatus Contendobacter sp.]